MPSNKKLLQAAAGNAGESLYVEDVFSTYIYQGTNAVNQIINGIDLSGEGGMVWQKARSTYSSDHLLTDSARGINGILKSQSTAAEVTANSTHFQSWNSDGFTLGSGFAGYENFNGITDGICSWSFRKAEKFFDVVTYTGTDVDMSVPHNLGVTPGCVIIKRTDTTGDWQVMFPGLIADGYGGTGRMRLNTTAAYAATGWTSVADSTHITIPTTLAEINTPGGSYVAYLFASDAGGFGDDGSENIIKCGSYTTDSGGESSDIDLGFEPQWIIAKQTNASGNGWFIMDSMRGFTFSSGGTKTLQADSSATEGTHSFVIRNNGFRDAGVIAVNATVIYIAIRRPMKTPESGTEVFQSLAYTGDGASTRNFDLNLTLDAYFQACRSSASYDFKNFTARLTGKGLHTAGTGAGFATNTSLDVQDGLRAIGFENTLNQSGETYIINGFKRATGFMDVVAYSGTGSATTQAHNLGVVPEMMIVKRRDTAYPGRVYAASIGNTKGLALFTGSGEAAEFAETSWNSTTPSNSLFYLGNPATVNASGSTYIAYLFATLAGVSKVGSYTGTGSNVDVDCGFSAGARFILIKRTDSTGDWYVYDSVRGIVAGNDPYLLLNTAAAEVTNTDYIDPLSSGFTVTSSAPAALNASGGTYIFLAIA